MKTSVAMACFNGETYILEQLKSIINQTLLPNEIVISDDGSTDRTLPIVQEFINQNHELPISFKLIENNNEHGYVGNFENAVKNTTNELVFFCDQDDIWRSNKVEVMCNVMKAHEENVAFHNAQIIRADEAGVFHKTEEYLIHSYPFNENHEFKIRRQEHLATAFNSCCIQGMCICAKRDYLLSIMPFSRGLGHDYWVLFCAIADDSLLAVNENLTYYRIHKNNTCGIDNRKKRLKEKIISFDCNGKLSIQKQFRWYKDTYKYLKNKSDLSERNNLLYSFFTTDRIATVSERKITATIHLLELYKKGAYKADGKILLIHDMFFVWAHTKKYRKEFVGNLQ